MCLNSYFLFSISQGFSLSDSFIYPSPQPSCLRANPMLDTVTYTQVQDTVAYLGTTHISMWPGTKGLDNLYLLDHKQP